MATTALLVPNIYHSHPAVTSCGLSRRPRSGVSESGGMMTMLMSPIKMVTIILMMTMMLMMTMRQNVRDLRKGNAGADQPRRGKTCRILDQVFDIFHHLARYRARAFSAISMRKTHMSCCPGDFLAVE